MKAIVVTYCGRELSLEEQQKVANIMADMVWATDEIKVSVLNDKEVAEIEAAALVKVHVNHETTISPKVEDVLIESADILKNCIFNNEDSEGDVLGKLIKELHFSSTGRKEVVSNAIRVLGLYENPKKLMKGLSISKQAMNALKILCNSKLV